jgi:hypothetical protein
MRDAGFVAEVLLFIGDKFYICVLNKPVAVFALKQGCGG